MFRIVVLLLVMGCSNELRGPELPVCAPRGGQWDPRFAWPGATGQGAAVNAIVKLPDGSFVVAGSFDRLAGFWSPYAARWDGEHWFQLGNRLPGPVHSLAVEEDGALWAAGTEQLGEQRWWYVAHWDRERWTIRTETQQQIRGVARSNGATYVFGDFTTIGGIEAAGLARATSTTWSNAGLPVGSRVSTLTTDGARTCAYEVNTGIACWDGDAWSPEAPIVYRETSAGPYIEAGTVASIARLPDGRWSSAGAIRIRESGADRMGVVVLEADGWRALEGGIRPTPDFFLSANVTTMLVDGTDVIVGGRLMMVGTKRIAAPGLARFRAGVGWETIAGGFGGVSETVRGVLRDGERLHVVGDFLGIGTHFTPGLATIAGDGSVTAWTSKLDSLGAAGYITKLVETPEGVVAVGELAAGDLGLVPGAVLDESWHALPAGVGPALSDAEYVDGRLYVSTWQDGVYRLHGDGWQRVREEGGWFVATEDGDVFASLEGHLALFDGELYTLTSSGLAVQRDGEWRALWVDGRSPIGLVSNGRELVFATSNGIYGWNGQRWAVLSNEQATAITGCDGGVFVANAQGVTFHRAGGGAEPFLRVSEGERIYQMLSTATGLYLAVERGDDFAYQRDLRRWVP